ncbi:hypothetical protein [Metapseudomonas otitidis]|uniref:hypothetical protein n=1 Tax=Metapseudomonas otitidis TaxID=319939 RepID=UPI0013F64812|nr:hypothetical protein [Pseudomonas otitidis]
MNKLGTVKNPLSVIAIFAGIAEISGTGVLPFIEKENQYLYIWFLMTFPFTLILLFFATLNWNHKKLYAPSDYSNDLYFLDSARNTKSPRPEVSDLKETIEHNIETAINTTTSEENQDPQEKARVIDAIKNSIKRSSFITIDARPLTGSENNIFELPFVAFPSLNDLTDEIYFLINSYVKPFEYGHSWVLRRSENGEIIKHGNRKRYPLP